MSMSFVYGNGLVAANGNSPKQKVQCGSFMLHLLAKPLTRAYTFSMTGPTDSDAPNRDAPNRDAPGLDQLARRYLELWQDQLAAMAGDPELLATFQRLMSGALAAGFAAVPPGFAGGYTAPPQGPAAGTRDEPAAPAPRPDNGSAKPNGHDRQHGNGHDGDAAAGAAAAAAAPHDRGLDMLELVRRLGLIEARLAALEAGIARGRGEPDRGAEARRPGKVRRRP
jgi:hypothetical protein